MRNPFSKLILLNLGLCLVLGCARDSSSEVKRGGQDGGGGEGQSSSPEQVRAAITKAYKLVGEDSFYANIFARFWLAETKGIWNPGDPLNPDALWPHVLKRDIYSVLEDPDFVSPAIQALLNNERILKTSGDCEQRSRKHADAAVSAFNLEGKICFSVGNLTKIPPSGLLGEVLSLMIHEAVHLAGVTSEPEAESWQYAFAEYFRWRFGTLDSEQIGPTTTHQIQMADLYLQKAIEMNKRTPGHTSIFVVIGAFARILITLPHLLDPVALNLALHPKAPLLINNYANAVLALYEKTELNFVFTKLNFFDSGEPLAKIRPHQVEVLLREMQADLLRITEIFNAYLTGKNIENRNLCVLPAQNYLPDEIEFERSDRVAGAKHSTSFNSPMPPQVCAPGTSEN